MSSNKFCKVCFAAKKSEEEYTSHFVRDQPGPNGIVVCPYLLSLECRSCGVKGHTPKHCPRVLRRDEERRSESRQNRWDSRHGRQEENGWATTVGKKTRVVFSNVPSGVQEEERQPTNIWTALGKDAEEEEEPVILSPVELPHFCKQLPQGAWSSKMKNLKGEAANLNLEEATDLMTTIKMKHPQLRSVKSEVRKMSEEEATDLLKFIQTTFPNLEVEKEHKNGGPAPPPPNWGQKSWMEGEDGGDAWSG